MPNKRGKGGAERSAVKKSWPDKGNEAPINCKKLKMTGAGGKERRSMGNKSYNSNQADKVII